MKIFVVGGDLRQLKCAEYLEKKGFETVIFGFGAEYCENKNVSLNPKKDLMNSDCVLLPLPVTYDNISINTPLYEKKIPLEIIYENISDKTIVFGGMLNDNVKSGLSGKSVYDYAKNEEFLIKNAMITSEGAFDIIFSELPISVFGSKFLVAGYGRIGKIVAKTAKTLGADVCVSARKTSDLTWIETNGMKPLRYSNLKNEIFKFDIIVNTVPVRIFDSGIIENIKKDALYVDLASIPGGCDFSDMKTYGIKAIHALALPGKTAPYSSGKIISDTVINMLNKE